MKKILPLILFSVLLGHSAQATIITVNNNPLSVAQYNNLDSAVSAAAVNDTILLAPSATAYSMSSTSSNKMLYYLGAGFEPSHNANGTMIGTTRIRAASTFEGIRFV